MTLNLISVIFLWKNTFFLNSLEVYIWAALVIFQYFRNLAFGGTSGFETESNYSLLADL